MADQTELIRFFQDLITFFRPRNEGFIRVGECGRWRVLVWSRAELGYLMLNTGGSTEKEFSQLEAAMKGGGIIVKVEPQHTVLSVSAVVGIRLSVPKSLLCLEVSGGAKQFKFTDSIKYDDGDHFLLPVDAQSEEMLQQFQKNLQWLPPDKERCLLRLIARPRLEVRTEIGRQLLELESRARPPEARVYRASQPRAPVAPASRQAPRSAAATRKNLLQRVLGNRPAKAIAGSLLAMYTFLYFYGARRAAPPPLSLDTRGLVIAMERASTPEIQLLYKNYDLAKVKESQTLEIFQSKYFALALLNLVLLSATVRAGNSDLKEPVLVRESVRLLNDGANISQSQRSLVAYVSCKAFGDASLGSEVQISEEGNCRSPDASKAERMTTALAELVKFVKQSTFQQDAGKLIAAMGSSGNGPIQRLYRSHKLSELGKNDTLTKEPFAVAIIKLELLRLGILSGTSYDLMSPTVATDSVQILRDPANSKTIAAGGNTLLWYVACQSFNWPGLHNNARIPGVADCAPPDRREESSIHAGLLALMEYAGTVK